MRSIRAQSTPIVAHLDSGFAQHVSHGLLVKAMDLRVPEADPLPKLAYQVGVAEEQGTALREDVKGEEGFSRVEQDEVHRMPLEAGQSLGQP